MLSEDDTLSVADAEDALTNALGIDLDEGQDLSSYDPFADDSIGNKAITLQAATILAVATEGGQFDEALTALSDQITQTTAFGARFWSC
jgi:hypothetical protein